MAKSFELNNHPMRLLTNLVRNYQKIYLKFRNHYNQMKPIIFIIYSKFENNKDLLLIYKIKMYQHPYQNLASKENYQSFYL